MANVEGTFYSATTQRRGVTPVSPPNAVDDPVTPLNPPGSNPVHDPVTLGTPANGLSLVGQQLSIGLASASATGALSSTDWDKFNSFSLSDGLVIIGGAVQTGNDINYDTVWQVRISDVLYSPLVSTLISFPVTSSGFTRIDLTVLDNSGVISRVAGTEVAVGSPVTAPSVPANSVALQEVTIIDTGISAVTNFALSSFVRFDINNQGLNGTQRSNARTNIGAIGGTIASGQVAVGTGVNTIGGGNVLTWNEGRLNIVSVGVPSLTTYRDADVLSVGTAAQFFEMGARKGSVFTSAIRVSGVLLSDGNNGHLAASVLSGGSLVEYLRLIANGNLLIGTPTDSGNKLRVNGTVRIDTINNLGTAATVLLTKSATGVISERTLAELASDGLGSKWTDITGGIYRNGAVAIGRTTIQTNTTFVVQSLQTNLDNNYFALVNNAATFNLFEQNGKGELTIRTSGGFGFTYFQVVDSSGNNYFRVFGQGDSSTVFADTNFFTAKSSDFTAHTGVGGTHFFNIKLNSGTSVFNINTDSLITTNANFVFGDARNFSFGTTTGTKIGTANTQKLAFWNATPIVQPLETSLANTPNTGDTDTNNLITALKNIILNTGLARAS